MPIFVNEKEFIKATNLSKFKLEGAARPLMKLTGFTRLNALYEELASYHDLAFIDAVFQRLAIDIRCHERELKHIPTKGPFITVSNHPFGMLDGLALLKLILRKRTDYKIFTQGFLHQLAPIQSFIISHPIDQRPTQSTSLSSINQSVNHHVQDSNALGIFPSENPSGNGHEPLLQKFERWDPTIIEWLLAMEVPIVPVYFQVNQRALFHLLRKLNPSIRTMSLPAELLGKQNQRIHIRIGHPISVPQQKRFENHSQFSPYLQARTYSLGIVSGSRKPFHHNFKIQWPAKPIIDPPSPNEILQEIMYLKEQGKMMCEQMEYQVFMAQANEIPHILQELGRLREITFRAVGEGTNQRLDVDEYDQYYRHLFLWDNERNKIVGAYRMGLGQEIMQEYGKEGFYLSSLFKISDSFRFVLEQGIELGRSFVTRNYQAKRLPLFLLWKGISLVLEQHSIYRYLFGPVSISNQYSSLSKGVMVAFLKKYYYDHELAAMVKPRKRFKPTLHKFDMDGLMEKTSSDLKEVDKIIADIEPAHFRFPILLKKYIKQNARIIGFNIDPAFNQALDGFMVMNLKELPKSTIDSFK